MIEELAAEMGIWIDFYPGNVEPGYEDQPFVAANWNEDKEERLARACEAEGYGLEWSDEWAACSDCGKGVRFVENSYSWTPSYAFVGDMFLCHKCIREDPEAYVEGLIDDPARANVVLTDEELEEMGWRKAVDHLENGFYGKEDDPRMWFTHSKEAHPSRMVLFSIEDKEQFRVNFSMWRKEKEEED